MQAGYPVGTLNLIDEINMETALKIGKAARDDAKREGTELPPDALHVFPADAAPLAAE